MSQAYIAMTGLSLTENLGSQMWHFASLYAISRRTGHRIVFFLEHADLGKGLRLHRHFAGLPFELVSIESLSEAERQHWVYPVPRDYYDAAFAEFDPAQVRFLVFSDDLAWCQETFANTPNLCFSDAPSPVVDLCAMSLCDHNIIANSSFSFWGAFLNRHAGKRVFCPAKTLKSDRAIPHLNHGWYPDEFTAIEAGNV